MGREAYLTFCLIQFSNPFFRTNLECKQGRKGLKSPYLIQQKKPDLSSDRDSIAVDRGRARITFSIRIRKGIALIACDSLSMLVSGEVPQTRSFKSGPGPGLREKLTLHTDIAYRREGLIVPLPLTFRLN